MRILCKTGRTHSAMVAVHPAEDVDDGVKPMFFATSLAMVWQPVLYFAHTSRSISSSVTTIGTWHRTHSKTEESAQTSNEEHLCGLKGRVRQHTFRKQLLLYLPATSVVLFQLAPHKPSTSPRIHRLRVWNARSSQLSTFKTVTYVSFARQRWHLASRKIVAPGTAWDARTQASPRSFAPHSRH